MAEPVPAAFYVRDPRDVAVDLLNKVLVHDDPVHGLIGGRIVEAEAYLGAGVDPGSHAFRGPSRRNITMMNPASPHTVTIPPARTTFIAVRLYFPVAGS